MCFNILTRDTQTFLKIQLEMKPNILKLIT